MIKRMYSKIKQAYGGIDGVMQYVEHKFRKRHRISRECISIPSLDSLLRDLNDTKVNIEISTELDELEKQEGRGGGHGLKRQGISAEEAQNLLYDKVYFALPEEYKVEIKKEVHRGDQDDRTIVDIACYSVNHIFGRERKGVTFRTAKIDFLVDKEYSH